MSAIAAGDLERPFRVPARRDEVGALRSRLRDDPASTEAADRLAESIDQVLVQLRGTGHRLFPSILRNRAHALGGRLRLWSAPGESTQVSAVLPTGIAEAVTVASDSVRDPVEVEADRSDAPVEGELFGQTELAEDRGGVFLDGTLGDGQLPGDGRVPPS